MYCSYDPTAGRARNVTGVSGGRLFDFFNNHHHLCESMVLLAKDVVESLSLSHYSDLVVVTTRATIASIATMHTHHHHFIVRRQRDPSNTLYNW